MIKSTQSEASGQAEAEYVGRWHRLVSTTNWEKGKIILGWREALEESGAAAADYSDEAWSRRVRNVSASHVGRLRRVAQRFGEVREDYEGLYWSHFQAALDWNDAEMWLEGALRSEWTVAQMKQQRAEVLGKVDQRKPAGENVLAGKVKGPADPALGEQISPALDVVRDPGGETDWRRQGDFPADSGAWASRAASRSDVPMEVGFKQAAEWAEHFSDEVPMLPNDLAAAAEALRVVIVRHKIAGWQEVSRDDVLETLDVLKRIALAS